jgi:negative regulator of flagellin synthesis FlgM
MKIDNSLKPPGSVTSEGATAKSAKKDSPKAEPGVSVELSALSSQLQALGSEDVVDVARVSQIKQAITDGRFKVNPDVVADRLLETVRELIVASKR